MHNKKLPKCHLAKYQWEVAAWEKAFGKYLATVLRKVIK